MDGKQIFAGNAFKNAQLGDNTNFQGNENTQVKIEKNQTGISPDIFADFIQEIHKLPNEAERNEALGDAQKLQEAVKNGNLDRAKTLYTLFSNTLRDSAAGIAIARAIGFISGTPI
ncbi:hypothetical protein [Aneurinibacillus migulanus]|uniref:Uncharacterized protein n=1 Tax=Aneurinibacillus migulanus TaxID=47500 RepID=A0A0D1VL91_ANEMI|nr:hypothetical protein [Aneurinibacillus migulanus]KIV60329.1 hypothetical protein TS65_00715 [Aneurinibacillus migulanus]KON90471.1 hypothetical protein AF333_28700 [Aneurinibacillus migulanus]MED0894857.1 hypothetical protein [Aneurinibacillus migulanus]MED1614392.1 hypothetical protein [Aneurinibacillus migulanus]SDJ79153.1 hypothetical protein SAMN04487909_12896 [Aneurinibacillus migulanus]